MSEAEFLGMLIAATSTLVGLFALLLRPIVKPITRLTESLTTLNMTVKTLKDDLLTAERKIDENAIKSQETHKKIWEHQDPQDQRINDLDKRTTILEKNINE